MSYCPPERRCSSLLLRALTDMSPSRCSLPVLSTPSLAIAVPWLVAYAIQLHTRFAVGGSSWYSRRRCSASGIVAGSIIWDEQSLSTSNSSSPSLMDDNDAHATKANEQVSAVGEIFPGKMQKQGELTWRVGECVPC